ncbi:MULTISPECIES: YeeE/YedE family protein [Dyella]|uniref:YeeE/YedE family protein n=2 Tax=Dyella TaxID=231454 RepID=A0A4R0YDF1_9GAMM|nr:MULTISPECIES: YeeE/YedE family protein [Dyella]TBR36037.1 YeeE/YedE family protein [Dyella terrae]TCI06086.1 YeeE/YedE family protein [Dyella soli]
MARILAALLAGALFGLGLVVSQMSDPRVVQGFLDIAGAFNPTLMFVLGGALIVSTIGFRWVLRQPRPLFDTRFHVPLSQVIDRKLIGGAALFGVGWGLAGYCPGPALVSLGGGMPEAWVFVPAMLAGGIGYRWWSRRQAVRVENADSATA